MCNEVQLARETLQKDSSARCSSPLIEEGGGGGGGAKINPARPHPKNPTELDLQTLPCLPPPLRDCAQGPPCCVFWAVLMVSMCLHTMIDLGGMVL